MNCSGPRRGNLPNRSSAAFRLLGVACAALLASAMLSGCASDQKMSDSSSSTTNTTTSTSRTTSTNTSAEYTYPAELDASYLIGPTAARDMDCRIAWQKRLVPSSNSGIKLLIVQDDSVFVVDGRNLVTRLRRDDGDRVWTLPVAGPLDDVHGLIYTPASERLYVAVTDAMLVLDSGVGSLLDRQKLERIANTPPVLFGSSMLYGSLNGLLVWHSYAVGTQWRAYQIADSIKTKPLVEGNMVIVAGANGTIMALNASSATQMWSKKLLDDIDAAPVAGNSAVFVAGVDQSLWAFDLASGRGIWRYRTESPLREAPTLIGDRVYQFVPDEGLVCLDSVPLDVPGGKVVWKAKDVSGRVIEKRRDTLLVWDQGKRTVFVVSASGGHVIKTISLPSVRHLLATSLEGGNLFAAGDDGRIIHLTWRN